MADGSFYTTETMVVTHGSEHYDAIFLSLWDGMNDALLANDPLVALNYLERRAQGQFANTFRVIARRMQSIVDEQTGSPVEGAVVVGIWQLESQGFEHSYGAAIHVVESVSDQAGRYHLPGFDARFVGHLGGQLMDRDPYVYVWAEGYSPNSAGRGLSEPGKGFHRVSPLSGRDIGLKREALDNRFIARLWGSGIRSLVNAGNCAVTQLPALSSLLESIEPQCDRILMEGYGRHCDYFHDEKKRCEGDGVP